MPTLAYTLTLLVQRLMQVVGAPAALELTRAIPKLSVDAEGNVLDYDRDNPQETARLLIEQYEASLAETVGGRPPQAAELAEAAAAKAPPQAVGNGSTPIRILVVDDHVLVREGLVSLIAPQPDLEVVGQAGSMREALTLARSLQPDVVLMDFTLPDGTGDEATRIILAALPTVKIVFLTVHDDDERLLAAIRAGAVGYLHKSVRSADLLSRLRGVVRGDVALSPAVGRRILQKLSGMAAVRAEVPEPQELTKREVEILRLIVQGHTNRQIADALQLSVRTVEYHRANITGKLGLHSRADLVRYASERGLLPSGDAGAGPGAGRREIA